MATEDKLTILAKAEHVYGEAPYQETIQALRTAKPPQVRRATIYNFRLDCPNCKCGISVELRTEN